VCWLLTLIGNIGVFITADLASFYLAFALVSVPAYGLLVHDATPKTQRAGAIYMALTLLGETLLLIGFVLLAAATQGGSLAIRDCLAALPASPWRDPTLALLIAGFGLKAGLVPLHIWMPLTYTAAPVPAASILSGAVVKAGVIGLIRFIPFDHGLPGWGEALASAGLLSAFYGVAVGITQANPKTVLAYSSISQMGLIATVAGMGLANGDHGTALVVAFYAAHRILAKGALFLAIGVVADTRSARPWPVLFPAAVLALGLAGLPLTGGALAKLAVKGTLGDGVAAMLATLSAAGSALLMLHFLHRLRAIEVRDSKTAEPIGLVLPWLTMESTDRVLQRWPVACLSLLGVAVILGALMVAGR
jgi:formate hydrogenlyase subunit 3/multisubunit Na+/H+ antiporter MnhD subunit